MKSLLAMNKYYQDELVELINKSAEKYKLKKSEYGHFFVSPMPTIKELSEFYTDKYFNNEVIVDSKGMDTGSTKSLERFYHERQYNEIITFLENHFDNKNIDILDVGCGTGKLLDYLYKKGYCNLQGTEYDSSLNNPKINIFNGDFLEFNSDKKYDFISFNNVLEHVIEPIKFIEKAKRLLKDTGFIRVQVPNDFSYTQYKALQDTKKANFYFFNPPEHLHYFNFDSMENCLSQNGFQVIKKMTNWSMDMFILMGLDYSQDKSFGKICHNYRVNLEYSLGEEFLLEYYEKMANMGIGRIVIEYAKKN
jgi:SAM-dependent methyltransferase